MPENWWGPNPSSTGTGRVLIPLKPQIFRNLNRILGPLDREQHCLHDSLRTDALPHTMLPTLLSNFFLVSIPQQYLEISYSSLQQICFLISTKFYTALPFQCGLFCHLSKQTCNGRISHTLSAKKTCSKSTSCVSGHIKIILKIERICGFFPKIHIGT